LAPPDVFAHIAMMIINGATVLLIAAMSVSALNGLVPGRMLGP
jgi:hypothetical protein